jgi:DNA-directed RNA polymerase subunit RPC12/RpoP
MTQIVARLVLAMLLLPATGAVFIILFLVILRPLQGAGPGVSQLLLLWFILYLFIGAYWVLLWRTAVRWTPRRVFYTIAGTALSLLGGVAMAVLCTSLNPNIPVQALVMFGGGLVPIAWVLVTVLVWRETKGERVARLADAGASEIVCPVCGYRMAGLREARCPECGAAFTIEQLVAAQPGRPAATAVV